MEETGSNIDNGINSTSVVTALKAMGIDCQLRNYRKGHEAPCYDVIWLMQPSANLTILVSKFKHKLM